MPGQISNKLHEEHETTLGLAARIAKLIQRAGDAPPDPRDANADRTLDELGQAISGEVKSHFSFEEDAIFPLLRERGGEALVDLLALEHEEILPLGDELAALSAAMRKRAIDAQQWRRFCQLAGDFFDRLRMHIEKEEAGLLPLVDELVDRDTEARIMNEYP